MRGGCSREIGNWLLQFSLMHARMPHACMQLCLLQIRPSPEPAAKAVRSGKGRTSENPGACRGDRPHKDQTG